MPQKDKEPKSMKILHVTTSLRMGGAERLVSELAPRFRDDGIDVDVLIFNGEETAFKQQLRQKGIRIIELNDGCYYKYFNPKHLFQLLPYLKRYDIVHTHNTAPQLFAALGGLLNRRTVLVTTEHSTSNRRRKSKCYAPVDRWLYGRYSKIICISDKAAENLKKHVHRDDSAICTIYNGIDLGKFVSAAHDRDIVEKYGDCKRLFMVSRFGIAKDHKTVIRAMAQLPPEYHLFFVGDGSTRPSCEALADELAVSDRVHFLGTRADIAELLKSAHIAILSSHWEGMPLAAIEAMSARRPLIASDVDGISETVEGAGVLFEHENADDLAAKIKAVAEDEALYGEIADRCHARAQEYDISVTVKRYEELYRSLLEERA